MKLNLKHYSALAAAFLAAKNEGDAQIIYTDIKDTSILPKQSYDLDLNNDGITDFKISNVNTRSDSYCTARFTQSQNVSPHLLYLDDEVGKCCASITELKCGDTISEKDQFTNDPRAILHAYHVVDGPCAGKCSYICASTFSNGSWYDVSDRYMGVKITIKGQVFYGWVRMDVSNRSITVKDYAYQSQPNEPIIAGEVDCKDEAPTLPSVLSGCEDIGVKLSINTPPCPNYSWYWDGQLFNEFDQSISAYTSGNYYVISKDGKGCIDTSNICKITIHPSPATPVITQTGDTLFSTYALSYQWYSGTPILGATQQKYVPTFNSFGFQVRIYDSLGCSSFSEPYSFISCDPISGIYYIHNNQEISMPDTIKLCTILNHYVYSNSDFRFDHYIWYRDGIVIPNAIYNSLQITESGLYYCQVSDGYITCDSKSFLVPEDEAIPTITEIEDTLKSSKAPGYQWYLANPYGSIPGATQQAYIPTVNATYQVKAIYEKGCSIFSDYFSTSSCDLLDHKLSSPDFITLCNGSYATLSVGNKNAQRYDWYENDTTISSGQLYQVTVKNPGFYYCMVTDFYAYCFSDTAHISVIENPVIVALGDTLISSYPSNNEWLLNGTPIAGATSQEYIARHTGSYSVRTTINDTCQLISNAINLVFTDAESISQTINPIVTVIQPKLIQVHFFNDDFLNGKIKILNALGQPIKELNIDKNVIEIPFAQNETGWFVIDIEKGERRFRSPIIIF